MMRMRQQTRDRRRESGLLDDVPRCSRCDLPNDRAPYRYCRACNRAYQKSWRAERVAIPKSMVTEDQAAFLALVGRRST